MKLHIKWGDRVITFDEFDGGWKYGIKSCWEWAAPLSTVVILDERTHSQLPRKGRQEWTALYYRGGRTNTRASGPSAQAAADALHALLTFDREALVEVVGT